MNLKTILTVSAVAMGSTLLFGGKKATNYMKVADNLQFGLKSVNGIDLKDRNIVFKADVELINPTEISIDIPGNNLVVKNIHFFTQSGVKLGTANVNVSEITLPANGSRVITNIPVVLSMDAIGASFSEILSIVSDPKQLNIEAELEVFGKSFTVNEQ